MNKRSVKRTILTALLAVAVCVPCMLGIAKWTDGDFDVVQELRGDRNAANLIKAEGILLKTQTLANGLEIEVDEDGVIEIVGKASEDWEATVAVVNLKAGTYTIGGYASDTAKAGIKAIVNAAPHYAGVDNAENGGTFTLTSDAAVTIKVFVKKDANFVFATKFKPTLAVGEGEIDFYK